MKISKLLDNVDALTDEAKQSITKVFEETLEQKVAERAQLVAEQAVSEVDEKHTAQLEKLLEAIDADHAQKFEKAIERIDSDHCAKLKSLVEHYEGMLTADASALRTELSEDISNFLDLYLEKLVPAADIKMAVENTNAKRLIDSVKQLVSIDEEYINDNIREALQDGKSQIDKLHGKINQTLKENIDLKKQLDLREAAIVLSEKTEDMPKSKKEYVYKLLESKSPSYIKNNFNYVVEMFESEDEDRQIISEKVETRPHRARKAPVVDTPPVITESVEPSSDASGYLKELQIQDKRIRH